MMRHRLLPFAIVLLLASAARAQDSLAAAKALYDEGRYGRAAEIFERLHLADPDDYEACMGFGRSYYMQHENNRSLALFERAAKIAPERAEPQLWEGYVLERRGMNDFDKPALLARPTLADAVSCYRRALELEPGNLDAHQSVARVLFVLDRFDEALPAVEAWLAVAPNDRDALAYKLGLFYRTGRFEEFLTTSAAAQEIIAPDLGRLLDANARLGRVAEAEKIFRRMFEEGYSGRLEPFTYLVAAWSEGGQREELAGVLQKLMAEHPEESYGWFYLGYTLARLGRYDEARSAFETYLAVVPNDVATLGHLTNIARLQNRLDDAKSRAITLIGLAPDSATARTELSATVLALVENNRFAEALALDSRLYDVDPDNPDFARNYAVLLKENGRLEDSAAIMKTLVDEAPVETSRLASFMNDYALCLLGLGRTDEAIAAFKMAAATWERQADARENLGIVYFEQGLREEARAALTAAIAAREAAGKTEAKANWRARYYLRALGRRP